MVFKWPSNICLLILHISTCKHAKALSQNASNPGL